MSKKKYSWYTVWSGFQPGVYDSWEACEAQVKGFPQARFKGFYSKEEALAALSKPFEVSCQEEMKEVGAIVPSICVDGASNQRDTMEYRGVLTQTGEEIFRSPVFFGGTNNIAEFLGIVKGLQYLKENKLNWCLYSDSTVAIKWVEEWHANTSLELTSQTRNIIQELYEAELWLLSNTWRNKILKWETEKWGENPADFGRK